MAASRKAMSDLHEALAEVLKEEIENPDRSPAVLNVARQFLRDAGIDVDPDNKPAGIKDLESAFDEHFVDGIPHFDN